MENEMLRPMLNIQIRPVTNGWHVVASEFAPHERYAGEEYVAESMASLLALVRELAGKTRAPLQEPGA